MVNEQAGCDLTLIGQAEHGETMGAVYVRWPDGGEGVISTATVALQQMRQTADVLAAMRERGLPVPRHDLVVELADGTVAAVQERLPGAPVRHTDATVIEAMLALNERFAGLLADRPDIPVRPLWLRESAPDYPRHKLLANHDARTRRMLALIREAGSGEPHEMTGYDVVHNDYTVPNVLFDEAGQISGIVDWNSGISRGDRRFAPVALRFDLTWAMWCGDERTNVQQEAIDRVDAYLAKALDPTLLRLYWAHCTLYKLHWAIMFNNPEVIDIHLRLGAIHLT